MIVSERRSPNFNDRPAETRIDTIVLHYTGMSSAEAALARLCDPAARVSAHYVVEERGAVTQLVPEAFRAWHAGISSWGGSTDVNANSIGVEIVNAGHDFGSPPYPDAQMQSVIALCQSILSRHAIRPRNIVGHSDVAPERKDDPGEWFDWERLARAGVGRWVPPQPIVDGPVLKPGDRGETVAEMQFMLASYGYGIEVLGVYDTKTEAVVRAFQRHFRQQKVDGLADLSSLVTLKSLLDAAGPA